MQATPSKPLIVGISSRALFNLDESNQLFESQGLKSYAAHQMTHEDDPLEPGVAFPLVKKLLKLNQNQNPPLVEVILLSRNSADTGLRIFNSIQHYQLHITRAVFTNGAPPYPYIRAFNAQLFLSANPNDVIHALKAHCAAATILPSSTPKNHPNQLRIAFDADAVLFSDESERIYQTQGLESFTAKEKEKAHHPLSGGPFKGFLSSLYTLQNHFPPDQCPLRTALVTARSAPSHERVIRTLRDWKIRIDEAFFLGGLKKGQFLNAFGADIYFDDQKAHCDSTSEYVATGHVPHGIINEK